MNADDSFHKWEKKIYGDDVHLSDRDREMWMIGFLHCEKMMQAKNYSKRHNLNSDEEN